MTIVPVRTCKLHAHDYYIPKILGNGGPQTLLVSLLEWGEGSVLCWSGDAFSVAGDQAF